MDVTPVYRALLAALAIGLATGCSQAPTEVEGVKIAASPTTSVQPPLAPADDGGLAVRLVSPTTPATVGEPVSLSVEYADGHGGLVGTVEDFGDGGLGGLKISDCSDSEQNPSTGAKTLAHTWATPGTYTVSVTVTTVSCVHGQEDVTTTGTVTVEP